MSHYTLPDLTYDYGALEPHISGKIVELHHDKHHQAYVKGANRTLEKLAEARSKNDFGAVGALSQALAFHVSGHVLHSLFWLNLSPDGGDKPEGELAKAVTRDFGSFDAFRGQMIETAATLMGSGWAALEYHPAAGQLVIAQIHDHQSQSPQAGVPLMVLDAWEHAYYLQYGPSKADYFKAIWNLWNWNDIAARFAAAKKLVVPLSEPRSNPRAAPGMDAPQNA